MINHNESVLKAQQIFELCSLGVVVDDSDDLSNASTSLFEFLEVGGVISQRRSVSKVGLSNVVDGASNLEELLKDVVTDCFDGTVGRVAPGGQVVPDLFNVAGLLYHEVQLVESGVGLEHIDDGATHVGLVEGVGLVHLLGTKT